MAAAAPLIVDSKQRLKSGMRTGLDSADLISQLRASHAHDAASRQGVDVLSGGMGDMNKLGIFESFKVPPSSPSNVPS